jgi:hypothetical protein
MEATAETRLEPALRRRFEAWFQEDLSSLRTFFFNAPDGCPPAVPRAWSIGSDVFLANTIAQATACQVLYLLVHEIAHVVQRRRAFAARRQHTAVPGAILEREANAAAAAFISGSVCPPLSPDSATVARAWGPSGHYYTVYAVARHAGVSDQIAEQLAFYAQLPDQVSDLDAIVAGEGFAVATLLPPAHRAAALRGSLEETTKTSSSLHCLNGSTGGNETQRRLNILKGIEHLKETRGRFAFGLGLHALGDSFAHRKGDTDSDALYPAPFGHLFGGTGFIEKFWKLGKDVDSIAARPALYKQYCEAMFGVIREKFGTAASPAAHTTHKETAAPQAKASGNRPYALNELIDSVVKEPSEDVQILRLAAFRDKTARYWPENEECMPWRAFMKAHPKLTAPWMPGVARQLLDRWS